MRTMRQLKKTIRELRQTIADLREEIAQQPLWVTVDVKGNVGTESKGARSACERSIAGNHVVDVTMDFRTAYGTRRTVVCNAHASDMFYEPNPPRDASTWQQNS